MQQVHAQQAPAQEPPSMAQQLCCSLLKVLQATAQQQQQPRPQPAGQIQALMLPMQQQHPACPPERSVMQAIAAAMPAQVNISALASATGFGMSQGFSALGAGLSAAAVPPPAPAHMGPAHSAVSVPAAAPVPVSAHLCMARPGYGPAAIAPRSLQVLQQPQQQQQPQAQQQQPQEPEQQQQEALPMPELLDRLRAAIASKAPEASSSVATPEQQRLLGIVNQLQSAWTASGQDSAAQEEQGAAAGPLTSSAPPATAPKPAATTATKATAPPSAADVAGAAADVAATPEASGLHMLLAAVQQQVADAAAAGSNPGTAAAVADSVQLLQRSSYGATVAAGMFDPAYDTTHPQPQSQQPAGWTGSYQNGYYGDNHNTDGAGQEHNLDDQQEQHQQQEGAGSICRKRDWEEEYQQQLLACSSGAIGGGLAAAVAAAMMQEEGMQVRGS